MRPGDGIERLRSRAVTTPESARDDSGVVASHDSGVGGGTTPESKSGTRLDLRPLCPADPFASSPTSSITSPIAPAAGVTLFDSRAAYRAFVNLIAEAQVVRPTRLLAYCVMPNHWHLVLWPETDDAVERFVGWLSLTHAKRFHRWRGTRGPVYPERYEAVPVEAGHEPLSRHSIRGTEPVRGAPGADAGGMALVQRRARIANPAGGVAGAAAARLAGLSSRPRSKRPSSSDIRRHLEGRAPAPTASPQSPTDSTGKDCQPPGAQERAIPATTPESSTEPLRSRLPSDHSGVVGAPLRSRRG